MTTEPDKLLDMINAFEDLDKAVDRFEKRILEGGGYMPALSTTLRVKADELAEKYPDDTNGGLPA